MTDQQRIQLLEYKVQALSQQLYDFMSIVGGVIGHEHYETLQKRVGEIGSIGLLPNAHAEHSRVFAGLDPLPMMRPDTFPRMTQ